MAKYQNTSVNLSSELTRQKTCLGTRCLKSKNEMPIITKEEIRQQWNEYLAQKKHGGILIYMQLYFWKSLSAHPESTKMSTTQFIS